MNKKNNAKKTVLLVLRLQDTKGKRETSAILVRSRHCNRGVFRDRCHCRTMGRPRNHVDP